MSRVTRDVMSVVKDERADDERCGQPVGFYTWSKEWLCPRKEGHICNVATKSTRSPKRCNKEDMSPERAMSGWRWNKAFDKPYSYWSEVWDKTFVSRDCNRIFRLHRTTHSWDRAVTLDSTSPGTKESRYNTKTQFKQRNPAAIYFLLFWNRSWHFLRLLCCCCCTRLVGEEGVMMDC